MIVNALDLARREIGRPDLWKPVRMCAYMQLYVGSHGKKTDEDGPQIPP